MASWVLNNVTTADAYTAANTLDNLPFPSRINLDVSNAAIFWQLKQADHAPGLYTGGTWGAEVMMLPGSRSLFRAGVRGFRVRSAAAGVAAQVTVEAVG
jgi:hypothetical protein